MKKLSFVLVCICATAWSFAQDHAVHGVVHTFETVPLIGAEIVVKSTKQSFYTDSLGKFVALCDPEDKLKVRAKGFYTQNVKINANTKVAAVNLKMKSGEKQKEHAIGYGFVSEEDLTNAVAGLDTPNTSFAKYNDIYDLIRSQVAGVQIKNGEIIMRGDRSFMGSSAALIVVDGAIWDSESLRTLTPIQVKSIDALKDGGAAVYGSRGANGVIIIETLKGGDEVR